MCHFIFVFLSFPVMHQSTLQRAGLLLFQVFKPFQFFLKVTKHERLRIIFINFSFLKMMRESVCNKGDVIFVVFFFYAHYFVSGKCHVVHSPNRAPQHHHPTGDF